MNKQNRQKVANTILGLTGLVGWVVFFTWAVVGTILGVVVIFVTGTLTFGLTVWPLVILGALIFWGPLALVIWGAGKLEPALKAWVKRAPEDPKVAAFKAHMNGFSARTYRRG